MRMDVYALNKKKKEKDLHLVSMYCRTGGVVCQTFG